MNKLIYFLVFFVIPLDGIAQTEIVESKEVEKLLYDFLIEQNEAKVSASGKYPASLFLVNALDFSPFDSSKAGIYKFVMFASHTRPFLLIYENEQMKIIDDYSISNVLKTSLEFFERNDSIFTNQQRHYFIFIR